MPFAIRPQNVLWTKSKSGQNVCSLASSRFSRLAVSQMRLRCFLAKLDFFLLLFFFVAKLLYECGTHMWHMACYHFIRTCNTARNA